MTRGSKLLIVTIVILTCLGVYKSAYGKGFYVQPPITQYYSSESIEGYKPYKRSDIFGKYHSYLPKDKSYSIEQDLKKLSDNFKEVQSNFKILTDVINSHQRSLLKLMDRIKLLEELQKIEKLLQNV